MPVLFDSFHLSLSESTLPQVVRTFLSILADPNNAVVWIVFTCPLISDSSSLCTNLLVTVPSTLITIGITISVSLFNGISTFVGYLMPNPFSSKNSSGTIWEDKGVHTFPKGICPKVNVIARLKYELAYSESVVHPLNHYTTRTPQLVSPLLLLLLLNRNSHLKSYNCLEIISIILK